MQQERPFNRALSYSTNALEHVASDIDLQAESELEKLICFMYKVVLTKSQTHTVTSLKQTQARNHTYKGKTEK